MKKLNFLVILLSLNILSSCSNPAVTTTITPDTTQIQALDIAKVKGNIVFAKKNNNKENIFLLNNENLNAKNLSSATNDVINFQVSPDSKEISFISDDSKTDSDGNINTDLELYVMNIDGSNQKKLAQVDDQHYSPKWSPDGQSIVFTEQSAIYTINKDGSNLKKITSGSRPSWSNKGDKIAFVSSSPDSSDKSLMDLDISIINSDGTNQLQLTKKNPLATIEQLKNDYPVFSPKSDQIAFVSNRGNKGISDSDEIYLMNSDGTDQKKLTTNSDVAAKPIWSPDGTKILFEALMNSDLYLIDTDGKGLKKLTDDATLSLDNTAYWSFSNDKIIFQSISGTPETNKIYAINSDGSNKMLVITDGAAPTWE